MASAAPVTLSVVIPAYNEAARLPETLAAVRQFLDVHAITHEVIVVDDGSADDTANRARAGGARVMAERHRGKAAALRVGVRAATGDRVLLMDADLATPIDEWTKCAAAFDAGADIVIGSRELPDSRRIGEPWYRHVMGRVFNWLVQLLVMRGIRDTQCGFKAMRRTVAVDLFRWSRLYPDDAAPLTVPAVTAYDVELLYVARRRGYTLSQIPVTWRFDAGTLVHPWRDTVRNFRDLWTVRRMARLGLYPGPTTEDAHALHDSKHGVVARENRPQSGVPLGRELAEVRDIPR
ncbi:MAG: dolichyl-phosphate beta-glucosyltransferase [Gemmatimonadota bacterium]